MREAQEVEVWEKLRRRRGRSASDALVMGDGYSIDVSLPCTVIGGRNGAGKSRLLRRLNSHLADRSLLLDLHHLTEQALILYRSRDDFDAMTEELDPLTLSSEHREDVEKIVGRRYESIEWFSVEIEPDDADVASRFRWIGPESPALVPFFRATYRGRTYTSAEMGLGEFSVHFLFWVLELIREDAGLVLLLDEPDAYLPPVGVRSLLARLLRQCADRNWSIVLSTHSEEMISLAVANKGFTLVEVDEAGGISLVHSADDPLAASTLLTTPPIDSIAFAEDESACAMARGLLLAIDPERARRATFVWGGGDGYLKALHKRLPRPPKPAIRFAYIFDGDQRGTVNEARSAGWRGVFLPTPQDPDELMQGLAPHVKRIAEGLNVRTPRLRTFLSSIEGEECHDWVNKLGEQYGRAKVLDALPAIWADLFPEHARTFVDELVSAWDM